jgi:hypothetical protein
MKLHGAISEKAVNFIFATVSTDISHTTEYLNQRERENAINEKTLPYYHTLR